MPDLIASQRAIAAALRDRANIARAATLFVGDGALVDRRLAVYRGNAVAASAKALGAAFPVAKQVVGEEFFDGLARRYWQTSASTSGDLHEYGDRFAEFVSEFEPARELPYLADLVRLEWLVHQAYCAPDSARLMAQELAAVAPEEQASLHLEMLAGAGLMASPFPIVRIWTIHQPSYQGQFNVDWSVAERALVTREGMRVTVTALSAGPFALYDAFARGRTLEDALQCAEMAEPGVDLVKLITEAVSTGPLSGLRSRTQGDLK